MLILIRTVLDVLRRIKFKNNVLII